MKLTFHCVVCGYDNGTTMPSWLAGFVLYYRCPRCGRAFTITMGNVKNPVPAAATPSPIGLVDLPALYDEIALHLRRTRR